MLYTAIINQFRMLAAGSAETRFSRTNGDSRMTDTEYDIRSLIGNAEWRGVQDAISRVTNTTVAVVDSKGVPVVNSSGKQTAFDKLKELGSTPKRCMRCILRAETSALGGTHSAVVCCKCGLAAAVVPIMAELRQIGSVLVTRVRLPQGSDVQPFDNDRCPVTRESAAGLMAELPEMSAQSLTDIAFMVSSFVAYLLRCVREAGNGSESRRMSAMDRLRPEKQDVHISVPKSSKVYPAVYYVELNRTEMVGMSEMAVLCDLSPSYFSKLFLRETGENFSNWVSRRKTDWAREMLELDGIGIGEISEKLGFADTSYFIKVFRKYVGMTPMAYRTKKYSENSMRAETGGQK